MRRGDQGRNGCPKERCTNNALPGAHWIGCPAPCSLALGIPERAGDGPPVAPNGGCQQRVPSCAVLLRGCKARCCQPDSDESVSPAPSCPSPSPPPLSRGQDGACSGGSPVWTSCVRMHTHARTTRCVRVIKIDCPLRRRVVQLQCNLSSLPPPRPARPVERAAYLDPPTF